MNIGDGVPLSASVQQEENDFFSRQFCEANVQYAASVGKSNRWYGVVIVH